MINEKSKNEKLDINMNRRNMFSKLGKGLMAISALAVPAFSFPPQNKRKAAIKPHPKAVKRNPGRAR